MAIAANREEFQQYFDNFLGRLGFDDIVTTLQLTPHDADGESVTVAMPLTDAVAQASGMFSGAAMFGAADIAGTFLSMMAYADSGQFPLVAQTSTNFLSNSKKGPALARATLLRGGGSMAVVEATVSDAEGKALTHSTLTYVIKERAVGKQVSQNHADLAEPRGPRV